MEGMHTAFQTPPNGSRALTFVGLSPWGRLEYNKYETV